MQKYIGMNIVNAKPITLGEFNALFGSQRYVKSEDEGYLVEYIGSKPNHSEFDGHITWFMKEDFERIYGTQHTTFSEVLLALQAGYLASRRGWNGDDMFLVLVHPKDDDSAAHKREYTVYGMTDEVGDCLPWIALRTADNKLIPWTPSQQDLLATDWMITR